MGTNYYVHNDACPTCGRHSEHVHVGKYSAGWKFLFARNEALGLTTKAAWFDYLDRADGRIADEYGVPVSASELKRHIEEGQANKLTGHNCYAVCGCSEVCRRWNADPTETIDNEGFRISDGREFF